MGSRNRSLLITDIPPELVDALIDLARLLHLSKVQLLYELVDFYVANGLSRDLESYVEGSKAKIEDLLAKINPEELPKPRAVGRPRKSTN